MLHLIADANERLGRKMLSLAMTIIRPVVVECCKKSRTGVFS